MKARHWFRQNFAWKLISVLLAAVVWWQVHPRTGGSRTRPSPAEAEWISTREFTLPVRILTSPRTPRGCLVTPAEVTVSVSGPTAAINALSPDQIQVYVDLDAPRDSATGLAQVCLNPPDEVKWARATPRRVRVDPL
jgi:hypothetical protein